MAQQNVELYKDPNQPVEARVKDLLHRMTLEEKIAQMRHVHSEQYDVKGKPDIQKLNEFTNGMSFGCVEALPYSSEQFLKAIYHIQKHLKEKTRLGIPIIPIMEGLHGTVQDGCTIYPQSIALASTFNPELAQKMAEQIAGEMKVMGVKQALAPDLDLAREQRWGRVEETYGEDPFLVGRMGVAYVKGLRKYNLIATPKHFVAHGTPLGGINLSSVEGGDRQLFSMYLPPFEKVIKEANPLSIMNCYSSYDGVPITGSSYFLTDILRKRIGFKGYVYSDWGSVSMLYYFHKTATNGSDAALQSVKAGVDLEAGGEDYANLLKLVQEKKLDEKYIDSAVSHILYAKFSSGLFEDPLPDTLNFKQYFHTKESVALSKKIANESIVLLKNESNILPFDINKIKSLAVVGPNADQVQFGDYSWSRNNKDGITPLAGLRKLLGNRVKLNYASGCDLTSLNKDGFANAIKAAQNSDAVVVFVGSQSASLAREYQNSTSGEGFDLSSLTLPGVQEELIQALHATGKQVIVVLVSGRPFALPFEAKNIPAILVQWYGGEQAGAAIAEVLFGDVNPSGKLPISFAKSEGHLPAYYNHLPTDKGYYKSPGTNEKPGRDYVFSSPEALYSFGHGLSYTKFDYTNLKVSKTQVQENDTITISVEVKNTGDKDGAEVVQLYVRDVVSSVATPVKQLKGFSKLEIKAGEMQIANIQLPISELFLYNQQMQKVVEPGEFELQIGASSSDIKLKKTITLVDNSISSIENSLPKSISKQEITNPNDGKQYLITGTVRDVQATVLPGVTVMLKGKSQKTITNSKGSYQIQAGVNDVLQFSVDGYTTREVKVGKSKVIDIRLAPSGK
ncbi:glycosyl hydrolase [Solitalea longa]|uniref:Glycosyl hydrolase n=2 Tax=Solitalea longa TaxID=2079460 RepID=A0A2S5A3U4_9SPHI|nr:glycosyl hydrolase [Solitalea longa]